MAFTISDFTSTRPYLYHLTSDRNLPRLLDGRLIHSAAELLKLANEPQWLDRKRDRILTITVAGEQVDLRDQQPLYEGKTKLQGGWSFSDLVRELNHRVFFWPGWEHRPIAYGERHFQRYAPHNPVIVRVKTEDLFHENAHATPQFCKYNSGSPRTTQGLGSPRGPSTFVECHAAPYTASTVVEVTFQSFVRLPRTIESANTPYGPWRVHDAAHAVS